LSSPLRPPPTSPLFPYTTLFRSFLPPHRCRPSGPRPPPSSRRRTSTPRRAFGDGTRAEGIAAAPFRGGRVNAPVSPFGPNARQTDRKSTRLNSSHRTISYAVFCL